MHHQRPACLTYHRILTHAAAALHRSLSTCLSTARAVAILHRIIAARYTVPALRMSLWCDAHRLRGAASSLALQLLSLCTVLY